MELLTIFFIGIGLAMDAFAVSLTTGLTRCRLPARDVMKMALFFGGFQAAMPVLGWLLGRSMHEFIDNVDHWVAFILLSFIGGKMIYESFQTEICEEREETLKNSVLLYLALATSIDAMAVGVSFAFLGVSIIIPVVIIGVITFILSVLGVQLGKKCGHLFEKKVEVLGGVILIVIGLKILLENLL